MKLNSKIICIILIILVIIAGISIAIISVNKDDASIDNGNKKESTQVISGTYELEITDEIRDEYGSYWYETKITFFDNNTFLILEPEGASIAGTYSINDNEIMCKVNTYEGEYLGKQDVVGYVILKIIDDSTLEGITASTISIAIWTLEDSKIVDSGERKDLDIALFNKAGTTYKLEK